MKNKKQVNLTCFLFFIDVINTLFTLAKKTAKDRYKIYQVNQ